MIVFDLSCDGGHRFEGWFGSSEAFADQKARGLIECPACGSSAVAKAPMAPAVPAKNATPKASAEPVSDNTPEPKLPAPVRKALEKIARAQAESLKTSTWVGTAFAEQSRAMHYGEQDEAPIHGRAEPEEARALLEEGVPVAPLLIPIAPPDEVN